MDSPSEIFLRASIVCVMVEDMASAYRVATPDTRAKARAAGFSLPEPRAQATNLHHGDTGSGKTRPTPWNVWKAIQNPAKRQRQEQKKQNDDNARVSTAHLVRDLPALGRIVVRQRPRILT